MSLTIFLARCVFEEIFYLVIKHFKVNLVVSIEVFDLCPAELAKQTLLVFLLLSPL